MLSTCRPGRHGGFTLKDSEVDLVGYRGNMEFNHFAAGAQRPNRTV